MVENDMYDAKGFEEFFNAYLECALWSSTDNSDEYGGEPLDKNYGVEDIAEEALAEARKDCWAFFGTNYGKISRNIGRAGHDFWLNRNGHGAGFWDGDWPEEYGKLLDAASKAYGSVDLYVGDDGKIYGF